MGYQDENHTPPTINIFVLQQVNIKSNRVPDMSEPFTRMYPTRKLYTYQNGPENLLIPEKIHIESFLTFWRREWG